MALLRQRTIARRLEPDHRELLETLTEALGPFAELPLGRAALDAAADIKRAFGDPVPLTEEERAKGQQAAFVKDGNRVSIGIQARDPFRRPEDEEWDRGGPDEAA